MKEKQLQQIIAASMYAGSLLTERNYGGEITTDVYKPFVASIQKLKGLVDEFSSQNNLDEIDVDTIFPLYKEIETILNQ